MSLEPPTGLPPTPPASPPASGGDSPPPGNGESSRPRMPWEDRDRLGYIDALIETAKLVVTAPGEAFSRLRPDGDLIWPLIFGLIFSWLGQAFSQLWNLLFGEAMRGMMTGLEGIEGFEGFAFYTGANLISAMVMLFLWPILFVIGLFIGSSILHLCLMLVGATDDSPMGFEGTLKVVAYSRVASLAAVIPIVGGLIGMFASLILTAIGLARVHATTQGRAVVAVLIPVAFCCLCCGLIFALAFGGMFAAALAGAGG